MKLKEKDYLECIRQVDTFKELSSEELNLIGEKHNKLRYRPGEYICKQGSFSSQIVFLKKGLVKVFLESGSNNTILTLETEGTFLGLSVLFGKDTFPYSVVPLTDSVVCLFDKDDFETLLHNNAMLATEFIGKMNDYVLRSFDRLNSLSHKQLHGRLADILNCLSERIYFSDSYALDLSRKDLAELTAMSQESLCRVIKDFNEENIVKINGKEVEILDKDRLLQISKTG